MAVQSQIKRLADAGLVDADMLDDEDRAVLEQLTDEEVTVLVQLATRLYPEAPAFVKVGNLRQKRLRICVPL